MPEVLPDPSEVTAHQRLVELADLFATGYVRARRRLLPTTETAPVGPVSPPGAVGATDSPGPRSAANAALDATVSNPDVDFSTIPLNSALSGLEV